MKIRVDKTSAVPIYEQIKEQIKGLVHAGQLRPGDQLPTMRSLAVELAVNLNTIAFAYRELDSEGVISTRRGEGTYVASLPSADDLVRLREKKLRDLVESLFQEATRLGYSPEEVRRVVEERLGEFSALSLEMEEL